jgi:hypothetical protein
MRDFERTYYPNNLTHKDNVLINDDEQYGKKFAEETFAQIKKKYRLT